MKPNLLNLCTYLSIKITLLMLCSLSLSAQQYIGSDFSGDGAADFAFVSNDDGQVTIKVARSSDSDFDFVVDEHVLENWIVQSGDYAPEQRFFYADFNGDGRMDIAKLWDDGGQMSCTVFKSEDTDSDLIGDSFVTGNWAVQLGEFKYSDKWYAADVNGDFMTDLVRGYKDGTARSIDVLLSNGTDGFNAPVKWASNQGAYSADRIWLTGDFNGDFNADFAVVSNNGGQVDIEVHSSNGATGFSLGNWAANQGAILSSMKWVTGDFNGDGLTDIARVWNDNDSVSIVVHSSTGSGFTQGAWLTQSGAFAREDKWFVGDFSGDFMDDIARIRNDNGLVSIDGFISDGSAFTISPLLVQGYPYRDQSKYYVGDFNGDLVADVAVTYADENNWYMDVISQGTTLSNHVTDVVGGYYSDQNLAHQVWGDNFINWNAIVGPVPVPATGQESLLQDVLDAGNDLFLVKNGVYNVNDPLTYKADYQRIETFDAILLSDFAILRQQIDLGERDRLIKHGGQDYIHLENVICDGNKYNLGQKAWVSGQGAMVSFGAADGHWVRRVIFYNTRTWSTCQIHEGDGTAHGSIVEHNYVLGAGNGPRGSGRDLGEKGNQSEGGTGNTGWADGFSIGAKETTIRHNFIMDCTDVGVVLFGVPDGYCHDNFIFNYSRESLGGINLVDGIPRWNLGSDAQLPTSDRFDYRGLRVENNVIGASGARIQLGIPVSNQAWVPEIPEVFDFGGTGTVTGNRLFGSAFGYGYILSHVRNLNFVNNVSTATHSGKGNGSNNAGNDADNGFDPDPATAFLRDTSTIFGSSLNNAQHNWTNATKKIAHLLYMNRTPYNADGYHYYPYTDPEAEAIVTASYLEMLGRAPTSVELTNGKNQFLSNDQLIGDDFRRGLMNYNEFIGKFGSIGPESLHVFRTARWRDRVIALDTKTLIENGNYANPEQLHDDILVDLQYTNISSTHNSNITLLQPALPSNLNQGDVVTVNVVIENTGTATWQNSAVNPEKIAFASLGDDTTFGTTRYYLPNGVSVAPGETYTFALELVAPPVAYDPVNLGPTAFPIDFKMLVETVGWFGESLGDHLGGTPQIAVQHSPKPKEYVHDSVFVGIELTGDPQINGIKPGDPFIAQITFRNEVTPASFNPAADTFAQEWSADDLIFLGFVTDAMTWGTNRGFMDNYSVVKEGDTYTFNVALTAPATEGTYGMQWQLLNPQAGWFGGISPNLNINVSNTAPALSFDYARFIGTDMPEAVLPGSTFDVSFTMKNEGTTTWSYTGPDGYSLGTTDVSIDRTDSTGSAYATEFNDAPAGQGVGKLFDNDSSTRFATFNNNAWVQHRFEPGVQHVIKQYSITSAPAGSPNSNVISNGSFENGGASPNNWSLNAIASSTTEQAASGSRSIKFTGNGSNTVIPSTQDIPVNTNTDYEISVWVNAENMTSGPLVFDCNDKPSAATEVQFVIQPNQANGWTEFKGNWNSGSETTLRIRIFGGGSMDGVAYVDSVAVVDLSDGGGEEFDPTSWTVSGSNDGTNWTSLGSESGVDFPTRRERKEFDLSSNNTAYEYYRLDMTNNSGGILQLSEVELITAAENPWNTVNREPVSMTVAPGGFHTFRVSATAPNELGFYPFQWQMVNDQGANSDWFGSFTPSAQIEVATVVEGNAATFVGYNLTTNSGVMTTEVRPGVQFGVELTFVNSGSTTWNGNYATGNIDEAGNPWTVQQVTLDFNETVEPGETFTQYITATAPSTPGNYNFQRRMLQQGVEWFGLSSTATVINVHAGAPDAPPPATSSSFISYSNIPNESGGQGSIKPGAGFNMQVTYENNGITPWNGAFELGEQPVDTDVWTAGRYSIPGGVTVNPGEQYTFSVTGTAPLTEGAQTFSRRMLNPGGAGWFGEVSTPITINVSSSAPDVDFNDSRFVAWSAPNGAIFGQTFNVDITFENTGNTTWSAANGFALATNETIWTGSNRFSLGAAVIAPGQSHTFTIPVTAPSVEGLYNFQWGMVEDGGVGAFGNLTPAKLISVSDVIVGNASQFVSHNAPAVVPPGIDFEVEYTFRNIGTTTWDNDPLNSNTNAYKTGSSGPDPANDLDNLYFGVNRQNVGNNVSVATGEEYTFTSVLTSPSSSTDPAILPGSSPYVSGTSYPFHRRMIQEGVQWFGDTGVINIVVDDSAPLPPTALLDNGAQFVSQNVPASVARNASFTAEITFLNTGDSTWSLADKHFLGSANPQDNTTWGSNRGRMNPGDTVAPGQQYTFVLDLIAPLTVGAHNFQWDMLQDGRGWFGTPSTNLVIDVLDGPINDAEFVSVNVPTTLDTLEAFTAQITVKNIGGKLWTAAGGYKLGSENPRDNSNWGGTRIVMDDLASIGDQQQYTFVLNGVAPDTPGTYNFQWQMIQEGVQWFGPTSTNVSITVNQGPINDATFVSQNVPGTVDTDQAFTAEVTYQNTGTTTWTEAELYKIGSRNPVDNMTWGTNRAYIDPAVSVAPGEQYTFNVIATAPSTAGSYDFQWQPVQEGKPWFGEESPNLSITVNQAPINDSIFVSQTVPTTVSVGAAFVAEVTFRNNGNTNWSMAGEYKIGSQNPMDNTFWGDTREIMDNLSSVAPGEDYTFMVNAVAPAVAGTYNFQWQMIQEGVEWFGPLSTNVAIVVEAAAGREAEVVTWVDRFDAALPPAQKELTADPDGDGYSNEYEYLFGMDPTDSSNSRAPSAGSNGNAPAVSYTRQTGESYTVQYSTDLENWSNATVSVTAGPSTNADGTETLTVTSNIDYNTEKKQFFRIQVSD